MEKLAQEHINNIFGNDSNGIKEILFIPHTISKKPLLSNLLNRQDPNLSSPSPHLPPTYLKNYPINKPPMSSPTVENLQIILKDKPDDIFSAVTIIPKKEPNLGLFGKMKPNKKQKLEGFKIIVPNNSTGFRNLKQLRKLLIKIFRNEDFDISDFQLNKWELHVLVELLLRKNKGRTKLR